MKIKTATRCAMALLCAGIMSGCWFSSDSDKDKESRQPQQPADFKTEIKNGEELISWIKVKREQTELQRKESFAKLKGKYVVFKGNVRNVGKTAFGGKTYVSLRVDKLNMLENINIQFDVPESLKDTVAGWMKDESHIMRGKISGTGDIEDDASCSDGSIVTEEQYVEAGGAAQSGSKDLKTEIRKEVNAALEGIDKEKLKSSMDDLKKAADALKNL